ncbi:MAG: chemotaxis-specific protein-glutamate methyltransferase CheB [Lachnospiraceae bacterium]|nr:chemotaxis-specific protein-glutamate methyltransferase CheB [Lachnospiraceae bacterium]
MKKVLVIDDSALMRRVMSDIISNTNEYVVAYTAANGVEGLRIIEEKDDIVAIFCDINMPKMNGLELLKIIKDRGVETPFIIFSAQGDATDTFNALELGAMDFIKKPNRIFVDVEFRDKVNKALFIASSINDKDGVVDATYKNHKNSNHKNHSTRVISSNRVFSNSENKVSLENVLEDKEKLRGLGVSSGLKARKLVALVCSTGGPKALQSVIPKLPKNLAAPVLVVQHMPAGFTDTMANRLNELSEIKVKEASEGDVLKDGTVYIAKGGTHLAVKEDHGKVSIYFEDTPPIGGLKPCGNIMYSSICNLFCYDEIVCVVLTGMGADGTKGIMELSGHKKIHVIAQDEKTSTVYGMPKAIYETGLTDVVCELNKIAEEITKKVGVL